MVKKKSYSEGFISELIALAWCDKTSFEMIEKQTNLKSDEVKELMKQNLKSSSYKLWRKRVTRNKRKNDFKNKGVYYDD